jgi:4-diphosphocytidyl-2-C-methyl-D-erythritol kinase
MQSMHLSAPAKINVYLRIVGRRADGYHLLDSLMIPVSLYDELDVHVEAGPHAIIIDCDDPTLPTDATNLAYKAAALLCREFAVSPRITIVLRKRIPAGAGLGGGSSNAAAVLKSLNTLLSLGFSEERLCQLGAQLGADVPFFIPCRPSQVEGIGEILTAVPSLPHRWLVVAVPPFSVSTPWAYRRFDELPDSHPNASSDILHPGQWPARSMLINDLERAVFPVYPQLATLKAALFTLGAEGALMSGSGSSVFGTFLHKETAERATIALQKQGHTFLVEPLS